jgi:RNA polymerase sigma factor (sigma-70 family)
VSSRNWSALSQTAASEKSKDTGETQMEITHERVREIFKGLENGEGSAFFQHVAENLDWTVMGTHPLAGHYLSKKSFIEGTFAKLGQVLPHGAQLHTENVIVQGDQAAKELPIEIRTNISDMYLVAAAKDGDHQAYAELCRRHSKQILRTVLRITRDVADAEDTLQEALLKAYIHIGRFDGRSAFSSWLTRIAINSALTLLRKKRSQPVYSLESGSDVDDFKLPEPMETSYNPEESCIQNAFKDELDHAIRYLSPTLRAVVQIRYREDASGSEIAKILGICESTVKSRLSRARSKLRRHLGSNWCPR